jgi:hypothetical protein
MTHRASIRIVTLGVLAGVTWLITSGFRAGGTPVIAPRSWVQCSGHPRGARHLQVAHFTCRRAVSAIKRGRFELTPAGPFFSTPGFRCSSPILPLGPRFTVCREGHQEFRFYSFAEPRPVSPSADR